MEKAILRQALRCCVVFFAFLAGGCSCIKHSNLNRCKASNVSAHPKLVQGVLENGMRYMLLPNAKPENRLSLRLFVNAGAFMEEAKEDGLAHFIEHMAFNGSKNFPAGTLIKYFQRIGMGFGNDTNASTSLQETAYKLELPNNGEEDIRQGLAVLRDFADGALFLPNEVDRERGVILSELRTCDTPEFRVNQAEMKFVFPKHLFSKRFVIGTKESIESFKQKDFYAFYNRWYTPERMCLVIVGPMDTNRVVSQINQAFAGLQKKATLRDPHYGALSTPSKLRVGIKQEIELPHATIEFVAYKPLGNTADTEVRREKELIMEAIKIMFHTRWEKLLKSPGSPILGGNFMFESMLSQLDLSAFSFECNADKWSEALASLEKEMRMACKFGFLAEEIELAKKELRCRFENDVKSTETDLSYALADEIIGSLSHKRTYTSAEQDLDFFTKHQDAITARNCLKVLRSFWQTPKYLWVAGNFKEPITQEAVLEVYKKSLKTSVTAPKELGKQVFAYNYFGEKGKVKSTQDVKDLGAKCIRFENNVCLTLKPTDFSKNEILVQLRVGSGFLEIASAKKPGLDKLASVSFINGGLIAHDFTEIKRLFAGKTVGVNCVVNDDALVFSATTTKEDLRDQLNLLCAYLCYPGFRNEALEEFRKNLETLYSSFEHTASGTFAQKVSRYLVNGDERFGYAEKNLLEQRNFQELSKVLKPILAKGYIELCLVGDFESEKALESVAETFGALPSRAEAKDRLEETRKVFWPEAKETKCFYFDSNIPKTVIQVYWPAEDAWNVSNNRRLQVLRALLQNRLIFEVREKLGESYAPMVEAALSDTFTGRGAIVATLVVAPDKSDDLLNKIVEIGQQLATQKVEDDEFQRAVKPLLTTIKDLLKTNGYWMYCLCNANEYPSKLNWPVTIASEYQEIKPEEVQTLAQKYLLGERAIKIKIQPDRAIVSR